MNLVTLVGRLVNDPKIEEKENEKKVYITLAIPRKYKNVDGIYETDFIPCVVYKNMVGSLQEYCNKGDLIGVKGRLQIVNKEMIVVAEQATFLSSKVKE